MKVTYDRAADAAYVSLASDIGVRAVATTYCCDPLEVRGQIHLDFNADGVLIGIEILGASKRLPAALLASAGPP